MSLLLSYSNLSFGKYPGLLFLVSGFIDVLIPLSCRYFRHSSEPYLVSAAIQDGVPRSFLWDSIRLGTPQVSWRELGEPCIAVTNPIVSVAI